MKVTRPSRTRPPDRPDAGSRARAPTSRSRRLGVGLGVGLALVTGLVCFPGPGAAQEVRETRLDNGLRLSTVRLPGAGGWGAVLVLPVPAGLPAEAGTLLARGLEDAAGPGLRAVADADGLLLESTDSTGGLDGVLAPLARAVRTAVPAATVASLRRHAVDSASARLDTPAGAAARILFETVYGEHPYGGLPTPRELRSVGVAEVEAARSALLRPERASLVVVGDGDPVRVEAPGAAPPDPARPPGGSGRTVLVHLPGSREAVLHAGGLLPPGAHPDWPALSVLDAWLGTPAGPLFRVAAADGAGLVVGPAVSADRRAGPGLFHLRAFIRPSLLADALRGLRLGLEAARIRFPDPKEVRAVAGALADGLDERRGSPRALARLLAADGLLGLPDGRLRTVPGTLRALGPQAIREAALDHVHPDRMTWVVAGDATLLAPALRTLGPLDVVDARGRPLPDAAWAPRWRLPESPDLPPGGVRATYRVTLAGREVGTAEKRLSPRGADGRRSFRTAAFVAGRTLRQEVTFGPDFRLLELVSSVETPEGRGTTRVRAEEGRLQGTVGGGSETRTISMPIPPEAVVGDALELLLWALPFEAGARYTVPVALPGEERVAPVRIEVVGRETVEVPAGEIEAWRVEIVGAEAQTFWLREGAPHVSVRVQPAGQPLRFELVLVEEGDAG